MGISRRRFFAWAGIGGLWAALPGTGLGVLAPGAAALAAPAPSRRRLDLTRATADTFRRHVGSRFRLDRTGQRSLDLELVQVEPRPPDGVTDSFSLLFQAAKPVNLTQAAYGLAHAVLGTFEIFLVPGGTRLVAVVNHTLSASS